MNTRKLLIGLTALVAVTTALPLAQAQSGPAPGYDDPFAYAVDHVTQQVEEAAADPVSYAEGSATPEHVAQEVEHVAWVACWTADEEVGHMAGDQVCSQYYQAPMAAAPVTPPEAQEDIETPEAPMAPTQTFADDVIEALEETTEDPESAPSQIERIADSFTSFFASLAGYVLGFVDDAVATLHTATNEAVGAFAAITPRIDVYAASVANGALGAADGVVEGVGSGTRVVTDAGHAVGDGATTMVASVGGLVADAINGLFSGASDSTDAPPRIADEVSPEDIDRTLDDAHQRVGSAGESAGSGPAATSA